MDPARRITRERVKLLFDHPFLGHLCLGLEPIEKNDMPIKTMMTDGRRLFYDREFVAQVSDDELRAVLVHEIWHNGLLHIWRRGNRNPILWNFACDFAVNGLITQDGFTLPKGCLYDRQFDGKYAEQIYSMLPQPETISGSLMDSHDAWGQEGEGEEGEGEGKGDKEKEGQSKGLAGDREGDQGEDKGESGELEQIWRQRVAQAATAARMQGRLPGHIEQLIGDILEPKLDWRVLLWNFVKAAAKSNYRLCPPSKRHVWRGIYLPSVTGETLEIGVALDTSGSMSDELLQECHSEIVGIAEQFQDFSIHYFQCDHGLQGYWELTPTEHDWPNRFYGRGGTSFCPVFTEIEEKQLDISALIYLSDLYGDFPDDEPPYPVLWVTRTQDHPVPFGQIVELPE